MSGLLFVKTLDVIMFYGMADVLQKLIVSGGRPNHKNKTKKVKIGTRVAESPVPKIEGRNRGYEGEQSRHHSHDFQENNLLLSHCSAG